MYEKKLYVLLTIVVVAASLAATTQAAQSQLSLEPPTNPNVILNGPPVNFTADQEDRDIAIDPTDDLPANGTVTIGTFGATDMDINEFPPLGVSVIIQNQTVMVTNQTVTVGDDSFAEAQSFESSSDDSSSGSSDGNGDGDGGDEE